MRRASNPFFCCALWFNLMLQLSIFIPYTLVLFSAEAGTFCCGLLYEIQMGPAIIVMRWHTATVVGMMRAFFLTVFLHELLVVKVRAGQFFPR